MVLRFHAAFKKLAKDFDYKLIGEFSPEMQAWRFRGRGRVPVIVLFFVLIVLPPKKQKKKPLSLSVTAVNKNSNKLMRERKLD